MTNRPNSRAWANRRARWATRLPVPCYRCNPPVQPWDLWDLDHVVDRALGGTDDQTRPSHTSCNRSAGGTLARDLVRLGAAVARGDTPSSPTTTTTRDDDDAESAPDFSHGRVVAL